MLIYKVGDLHSITYYREVPRGYALPANSSGYVWHNIRANEYDLCTEEDHQSNIEGFMECFYNAYPDYRKM